MNAGAYGGEMKDVLKSVTVLTREGREDHAAEKRAGIGISNKHYRKEGLYCT